MPAKKLKPKVPTVTNLAQEDVEVVQELLRDVNTNKVTGKTDTFNRFVTKDRVGIVEVTTSVTNFGKKLSEIPASELNFKRLVF
jgi:hypothetical protein